MVLVLGGCMVLVLAGEPAGSTVLVLIEEPGSSTVLVLVGEAGGSMVLVSIEESGGSTVLVLPDGRGVEEWLGIMSNGSSSSSANDRLILFAESSRCTSVTDALPPRTTFIMLNYKKFVGVSTSSSDSRPATLLIKLSTISLYFFLSALPFARHCATVRWKPSLRQHLHNLLLHYIVPYCTAELALNLVFAPEVQKKLSHDRPICLSLPYYI